jgi:hypothetical protein
MSQCFLGSEQTAHGGCPVPADVVWWLTAQGETAWRTLPAAVASVAERCGRVRARILRSGGEAAGVRWRHGHQGARAPDPAFRRPRFVPGVRTEAWTDHRVTTLAVGDVAIGSGPAAPKSPIQLTRS